MTFKGSCSLSWGAVSCWGDFGSLFFAVSHGAAFGSVSCPWSGHCSFFATNSPVLLKLEKAVALKRKLAGGWYLTVAHSSSLEYKYSCMSFIGKELFYQTRTTNVSFKIRTLCVCIHRHTCASVFVGGIGILSRALLMIVKYFINELPPSPVQCFEYLSLLYVWYLASR